MKKRNTTVFVSKCILTLFLFQIAVLAEVLAVGPIDVLPSRNGNLSFLLRGEWKFKYIPTTEIAGDDAFYQPSFDVSQWKTITVPGHWELQGFAEPKYKKVDAGTGLYRRTFRVPASWFGQRIMLRFDGVQYGFTVWINGREIGTWASSYNPATFDITDALLPGKERNTIAVRVSTRPKEYEFDLNDCWALSGIYREVTLFAVPAVHFQDYTARASLKPDGSAELHIDVVSNAPAAVSGRLFAPNGRRVADFDIPPGKDGRGRAVLSVRNPQLWTAETPFLYVLALDLISNGKTVQSMRTKIGVREVAVSDTMLKLNGVPIKLRGINHHDIWPVNGRAATEELMRHDLEMMRNANINFIRTSHYPPHPRFIELCDEMGFYVMCEVPFGHGDRNLTDESFQDILFTRARATVMRDKNHPSVIVWSIGNENPLTDLVVRTARRTKELDPSRPICIPTVGSYFSNNIQRFIELPDFVDILSPHYPGSETIREYAAKLGRPIIFTEYAHALGLAADKIQEQWELMKANSRIAGGAVWMFQDQGILRAAAKPVDPAEQTNYVWTDSLHYYDTFGTDGADGIVYSDRTPQTDYWQLRKVYSPVKIRARQLEITAGVQNIALEVENRYDFLTLSGCTLMWGLKENGKVIQNGSRSLSAKPHERENVSITLRVPERYTDNIYTLNVKCLDASGREIVENVIRMNVRGAAEIHEQLLSSFAGSAEVLVEEGEDFTKIVSSQYTARVSMATGGIELRAKDGSVIASAFFPHTGRKFTMAEKLRVANISKDETMDLDLRKKRASIWHGTSILPREKNPVKLIRNSEGVGVTVRGTYARLDNPEESLSGEFTMTFNRRGYIELSYNYLPVNATGTFLEAGFSVMLPQDFSEFFWIGEGPYPGYPGKDVLNEYGAYHLKNGDIHFQGNRREVDAAVCANAAKQGVLLLGSRMDVAVESTPSGIILSRNVMLSGRGNKGGGPEIQIKAEKLKSITGKFVIMPLQASWPARLSKWLGAAVKDAVPARPFYHSYDQ